MSGLLDDDDRPSLQYGGAVRQRGPQPLDQVIGPRVPKAEDDDARLLPPGESDDLPEVEVEGEERASLGDRALEDVHVGAPLETHLPPVHGVVPLASKPLDDPQVHPHVGEKPHGRDYGVCTSSWASQLAYSRACWMSARSRSG